MHDVSSVLTKKNYGRKNPLLQGSAFRQPRWMELLGVLLFNYGASWFQKRKTASVD